MTDLTPLMKQYREIKRLHLDAILLFRMGDFYEMFDQDAVTASKVLEITLTARNKSKGIETPLCGFPYHAVEGYIAKLIRRGFKVAICEQVEDPKLAKGIVKREVIRVVTPGTVLDLAAVMKADFPAIDQLYDFAPGWDKYMLVAAYIEWAKDKDAARNEDARFIGWAKSYTKGKAVP